MRLVLTLVVFVLDVWVIGSILGSSARARAKLLWTMLVIALPLAGAALWLMRERKAISGGGVT